jgi:preprotein translocase subunit SecB
MKPKISPEEYREILKNIRLDTLYLVEITAKYNEDYISNSLSLDIKEKYNFEQKDNILKVFYIYNLTAKDDKFEKAAMNIRVKYVVKYNIVKDITIKKEFMDIFSDLTISLLLWTYFRELVNNTVYRMGMPPLILPMKRI